MVYSAAAGAELARVRCGGWRRQCAHLIASPADFTFAFYRDRHIHLARRCQRALFQATCTGNFTQLTLLLHYSFWKPDVSLLDNA